MANVDTRMMRSTVAVDSVSAMSKRPIPVAGGIVAAILVLLFANPPFVDWIRDDNNVDPNSAIGVVLGWLTWPAWMFTPEGGPWNAFIARELRAVLIIAFVFLILSMLAKGVGSAGVGFVVGWVAVILGAALAALIAYFISPGTGGASFADGLGAMSQGGTYGLFVGWIVGIGTAMAKRG
jgi:hypothetical protein